MVGIRGGVLGWVLVTFVGLCLFQSPSASADDCEHDAENFRCVTFISNYDGDTLTVDISGIHEFFGSHAKVRLRGVDSAELRGGDECEKEMARRGRRELRRIMSQAINIELRNISRGKFFRIVADVYADGKSVSRQLLSSGLAVPYFFGDVAQEVDWCGVLDDLNIGAPPKKKPKKKKKKWIII